MANEKLLTEALKINIYDKAFWKKSGYSYANWEIVTVSQKMAAGCCNEFAKGESMH